MKEPSTQHVIFFDGFCGLCNHFVDFIMKIDKHGVFKFSPLQSDFAASRLPPEFTRDLKTVIVQVKGQNLRKAEGVFAVFKEIGGGWGLLSHLGFLPKPLLNVFYDMVAENRYRLWGKKETCRLPTPEERERFII